MAKPSAYEKRVLRVLKTLEGADGGHMDTEELEKKAVILIYDPDLPGWMIAPDPDPEPDPSL